MTEEWRVIADFPMYEVSNLGRVRSWQPQSYNAAPRKEPRVLKPGFTSRSRRYRNVTLCRDGKTYSRYVHHLVLEAFVGPRPDGMECRHYPDSNPSNNSADNLRWGTPLENGADRIEMGTTDKGDRHWTRRHPDRRCRGERHGRSKLTGAQVAEIRARLAAGHFRSAIASDYGVTYTAVRLIHVGKNWRHVA